MNSVQNPASRLSALFGAVADPVGTIGKLFFGAKETLDQEEHYLEQEVILDLLCKMDDAFSEAISKAQIQLPKEKIIVLGMVAAFMRRRRSRF